MVHHDLGFRFYVTSFKNFILHSLLVSDGYRILILNLDTVWRGAKLAAGTSCEVVAVT